MPPLRPAIAPIERDDIPGLVRIADEAFGPGYMSAEAFEPGLAKGSHDHVLVARHSPDVYGFGRFEVVDGRTLREALGFEDEGHVRWADDERIGVVRSVAVAEEHQGRGLGSLLLEHGIWDLARANVDLHAALAWHKDGAVPLRGLLEQFDFSEWMLVPGFWRLDSLERGYECARCGPPPCLCSVCVFTRRYPSRSRKRRDG